MKLKKILIVCFLVSLNFLNVSCYDFIPPGRWIPLVHDVEEGDMEKVKRLLSSKKCPPDTWDVENSMNRGECYDINLKDNIGRTALFYAKSVSMAKLLISKGADIEVKDNFGKTSLYVAIAKKRYRVAEFLFKKGASPYRQTEGDRSPLARAKFDSRWYTFRLNKLIEMFEAYSPPEETLEETEEQIFEATQPDTGQSDTVENTQSDASNTSQFDVSETTQPDIIQPDIVEIESDFPLIP